MRITKAKKAADELQILQISGALEVRFDILLKHIFSTVYRNITACVGCDSKEIVKLLFSESVN